MRIKGVIFDLFHTLTARESEWSDLPCTSHVLGIDRRRWDELLMVHSRWRLAGEERDPLRILSALAREADPTIADDTIRRALDVRVRRFRDSLARIPAENIDALQRLRSAGVRLGLVSNADAMEMSAWADSPLAPLFDAVVFSCDVGCVKPEREIYEHCLRRLELPAADCLFVGDGGSNELTGARNAGLRAVFISGVMSELWPERVAERLAACDHHIERLPEIVPLVVSPSSAV